MVASINVYELIKCIPVDLFDNIWSPDLDKSSQLPNAAIIILIKHTLSLKNKTPHPNNWVEYKYQLIQNFSTL